MSYIKINIKTLSSGEVKISMKSECTLVELQSVISYLANDALSKGDKKSLIQALNEIQ